MKLRQLPEDFMVEEISHFDISQEKKTYRLYSLQKKSMETFSLIGYLSRQLNISHKEFGIAGLKDRHAVTMQYFTIPSNCEIKTLHEKSFHIKFLGFVDKKIKLGDLDGNKFEITVRDVTKGELPAVIEKAKTIEKIGVPNYFDSQRFGSAIDKQFIAKFLLKKDYEQAVKVYLTGYSRFENKRIKDEKRRILENWENLQIFTSEEPSLRIIINEYKKNNSFLEAYRKLPDNLKEIMVSAYQSFLWNECVKELLKKKVDRKNLYYIKYAAGALLFYKDLTGDEQSKLPKTFQTISELIELRDNEKDIVSTVLSREGLSLKDFDIKKETGNFFVAHERDVLVSPKDFSISEPVLDELNDRGKKNRFKFVLRFTLKKGSYATVITKRIFNH
jgi:tRNA pseudouridine13 synthase